MPTPTQLKYIVTVDKLRHFGRAADECHVSQPSLSMQIQKVEDELNLVIFDRDKKPVEVTERGRAFIEQAKIILHENEKLIEVARTDRDTISGNFRLGIIPTLGPYLLPLFIEEFSKKYPKVKLRIDEMRTDEIIASLKDDVVDAGLLATPLGESGLTELPLFYEPFYLYLGKDHHLIAKKKIDENDLEGSEMWLLQDGHCLRNQVVKVCSLKTDKPVFKNVQFSGGSLETLRYLIQKSRGYTIVPQLFVDMLPDKERQQQVKEFVSPVPTREISLIHRRNLWKSDILLALKNAILQNLPKNTQMELKKSKMDLVKVL